MREWIVVANRSEAAFYQTFGARRPLTLIQSISHPEGRLKNGEINADRPGRMRDRFGKGRHSYGKGVEPKEQLTTVFAKHISDLITKGFDTNQFEQVQLIAPSKFLGMIKQNLKAPVRKAIAAVFDKRLDSHEIGDVRHKIKSIVFGKEAGDFERRKSRVTRRRAA